VTGLDRRVSVGLLATSAGCWLAALLLCLLWTGLL